VSDVVILVVPRPKVCQTRLKWDMGRSPHLPDARFPEQQLSKDMCFRLWFTILCGTLVSIEQEVIDASVGLWHCITGTAPS